MAESAVSKRPKKPGYTDSIWSPDYAGGLGTLFQKLQQGVIENQQILSIASMRADAEETYSDKMAEIAPTLDRMTGGFMRDDGASTRKVTLLYIGVTSIADWCRPMKVYGTRWPKLGRIIKRLRIISAS